MSTKHKIVRVDNLMYDGCEPHWHCTCCNDYWPFHCFSKAYLERQDCPAAKPRTLTKAKCLEKVLDLLESYGRAGLDEDEHYQQLMADVNKLVEEVK